MQEKESQMDLRKVESGDGGVGCRRRMSFVTGGMYHGVCL